MEDRSRACDRCGAHNPAAAEYCWQCLAPFAPAGHQTASDPTPLSARPGGPPPPNLVTPDPDAALPARRRSERTAPATAGSPVPVAVAVGMASPQPAEVVEPAGLPGVPLPAPAALDVAPPAPSVEAPRRQVLVGAGVAGLAATAAVAMFFLMSQPKIRMPDQIAGAHRLETTEAETFERVVEGMAGADGVDVQAAVYSDDVDMHLFLVAGEDDSPITAEEALRAFSMGVEAADAQTTVRLTRLRTDTRGGVPFACAPMSGPLSGGLCSWKDPHTVGFVLAPDQPVKKVLDLTAASYDAARG